MKGPATQMVDTKSDPRYELAAAILKQWSLGEISEHTSSDVVARLAINLADSLYKQSQERGWVADAE